MLIEQMKKVFPNSMIKANEPLSLYTYTETGGPADILVLPKEKEEVAAMVRWINEQQVPLTVLGNASNLIVKDGGIHGVVMVLTEMNDITVNRHQITVQSGARLIDTSYAALEAGLTGLEFACGIPGSIGGAVFMNAGAYEGEVSEVIHTVTILTRDGEIKTLKNKDLEFSYRHSAIQETRDIVLEVEFHLEKGKPADIKKRMEELTFLRESKQPLEYPSCGSVFKRPTGYFTGKLIQEAGLQGKIWGGAQISEKHAGFIVNIAQATATDYIELIAYIQKVILENTGVELVPEVRIIGEDL
ncbi:MAG: UDP-N-acetylmuramate dehydrogenase [Carnobacterium sp.]|uniref:UDP-N-acetylenolpyruvoylglucosamine reductase n=1 Tax=Carnobacterium antarcticum TaxID=2126436 RepID=A0ABW4NKU9_9LACT|nr:MULTISPECIES: UDP-N-acetylmuramate dehydrogenase [unclassified Carnobacterium]ALV21901.1 UDP-N-acetylenolpyruvoylglucosamine reductase [Carnobacterium sp. CP1]QQP69877.1 UDP-N-acetylmuramate dehydrogenase [Carnobacterium sp. CS13]